MEYKAASLLCNILVFAVTLLIVILYFRGEDGKGDPAKGRWYLRFFTTLSNIFSAAACAVMAAAVCFSGGGSGSFMTAAVHIKFLATVTVMITLLTVIFFLAPSAGFAAMFQKETFHMHLVGPLLAFLSFCFLEQQVVIGRKWILIGTVPMLLYGALYLYKVVIKGEDNGGWPDFYGFNRNGKWYISIAAMQTANLLICAALRFLHNMFV